MSRALHTYVIVVNYRNWQDTFDCVSSVLASSYTSFSIVVVDNGSGNRSLEQLAEVLGKAVDTTLARSTELEGILQGNKIPKVLLVQHDTNAGFAAANNMVIKPLLHQDAFTWLLNPDMIIRPDTLEQLVKYSALCKEGVITGCVMRSWQQKEKILMWGGGKVNWSTGTVTMIKEAAREDELDYISGASLFCHASCFKIAGLLPEEYFLIWEETDWCQRARQTGISLRVCEGAVCYDKVSTVIGKGFLAHYYYTRNGLYFIDKYRNENKRKVLFAVFLRLIRRLFTGQWEQARGLWKGVVDYRKNKLHALE